MSTIEPAYRIVTTPPAPRCKQCGHPVCYHCGNWCDLEDNEGNLCCDGLCDLDAHQMAAFWGAVARWGLPDWRTTTMTEGPCEP